MLEMKDWIRLKLFIPNPFPQCFYPILINVKAKSQTKWCDKGRWEPWGRERGCWHFAKTFNVNHSPWFSFTSQQIQNTSTSFRFPKACNRVRKCSSFFLPDSRRGQSLLAAWCWVTRNSRGRPVLPGFKGRHQRGWYHPPRAERSSSRPQGHNWAPYDSSVVL